MSLQNRIEKMKAAQEITAQSKSTESQGKIYINKKPLPYQMLERPSLWHTRCLQDSLYFVYPDGLVTCFFVDTLGEPHDIKSCKRHKSIRNDRNFAFLGWL